LLQATFHQLRRPAELSRRLVARPTFKAAQHQGRSEFVRQTGQFLIEDRLRFTHAQLRQRIIDAFLDRGLDLVPPLPGELHPRLERQTKGDAVQEAAHRFDAEQRSGPPAEDKEGRLENVLGVVDIMQDAAADVQHHRPMPPYQGREGVLIAPGGEALEQFAIRQTIRPRGGRECVKMLGQEVSRFVCHDRTSKQEHSIAPFHSAPRGGMRRIYLPIAVTKYGAFRTWTSAKDSRVYAQ
jgi:hypothetical protein